MGKQDAVEKKAKELALAWLNQNRVEAKLPPLLRIEKLWWSMHKEGWLTKARKEIGQ